MLERIEDRNLTGIRPLIPPRRLKARIPQSVKAAETVVGARNAIRDLIHGRDTRRLAVIAGPCSIHDPEAAVAYARRLQRASEPLQGELAVVMRTYFEKPRTTVGWTGLISDPYMDGSCDVEAGLERARALLLEINELGMPCGSEVLDPFTPQYVGDLLCWGAKGIFSAGAPSARAPRRASPIASSPAAFPCRSASRTAPTAGSTSRTTP